MKSAADVTSCTMHIQTNYSYSVRRHYRSDMNTLFRGLFGTEANTKRIFGTSLTHTLPAILSVIVVDKSGCHPTDKNTVWKESVFCMRSCNHEVSTTCYLHHQLILQIPTITQAHYFAKLLTVPLHKFGFIYRFYLFLSHQHKHSVYL